MNAGSSLAHWFLVSVRLATIAMKNVVSDQLHLQSMPALSLCRSISDQYPCRQLQLGAYACDSGYYGT